MQPQLLKCRPVATGAFGGSSPHQCFIDHKILLCPEIICFKLIIKTKILHP